jgi:deazaflavin-dependent oxidoreductase (nitroreductase family)
MSNRRAMLTMTGLHRAALRLTRGRFGRQLGGMPVIDLTTRGRKSGELRTTILTVPHREPMPTGSIPTGSIPTGSIPTGSEPCGDRLIVIASRGGDNLQPAWYLNLVAEPTVQVARWGEHPRPYRARTADADERARLWPLAVKAYRGYAQYQTKTSREIPVVILEPLAETPPPPTAH